MTTGSLPRFRQSHCLPVRFAKSACDRCEKACPSGAVTLASGVSIDGAACTDCLACVSACPTAGLEAPSVLFWDILRRLSAVPEAVLACDRAEGVRSHATLPCVAALASEHIVALATFVPDHVSIDVSSCEECENSVAARAFAERFESVRAGLPEGFSTRLRLVRTGDDSEFQELATDRRGFFYAIAGMVRSQTMAVLAQTKDTDIGQTPYWEKIVPRERLIFERIAEALIEAGDDEGLRAACTILGFHAVVDDNCQLCFGCAGMCPNGALDAIEEESDPFDGGHRAELRFLASRCSGCGVCEEFCSSRSITVENGCDAGQVFEWVEIAGVCPDPARA